MSFTSLHFFIFLVLAFVAHDYFRQKSGYEWVLLAINGAFLTSFFNSLLHAVPLLLFLLVGYVAISLSHRFKKPVTLLLSVAAVILLFSFLKKYNFLVWAPEIPFLYAVVGMSYILFRVIHMIVDVYEGAIEERVGFLEYINYTCFFLSLVSGPIARYQDIKVQMPGEVAIKELSVGETLDAFSRILTGYFKIVGLSALFFFLFDTYSQDYWRLKVGEGELVMAAWFAFASVTYFFHLYFNFSGYMDVIIGIGLLFGYRLPENFNKPLLASSFLEFWTRWHITLSEWFRTYFFNPLVKWCNGFAWSGRHIVAIGVFGYFATFLVIGYWHTPQVTLAVMLGMGAAVNKLYQVYVKKLVGKKRMKRVNANSCYVYLCRGATFSYLAISIAFLWADYNQLTHSYSMIDVLTSFLLVWVVIGLMSALLMVLYDRLFDVAQRLGFRMRTKGIGGVTTYGWLAAKMFVILYASVIAINPSPAFIYMGF